MSNVARHSSPSTNAVVARKQLSELNAPRYRGVSVENHASAGINPDLRLYLTKVGFSSD